MKPRSVPYGIGTIEPRGRRFRVRVLVDGRYRDLDTVDTVEEGESLLRGFSAISAAGEIATNGETLREYGTKWLDQRELAGGRNTKTDRSRWTRHILAASFADDPLTTIGRRDIKHWVSQLHTRQAADKRASRRISPQTIKHCLALLRSCLQAAVDDELIALNAAAKIKAPKVSRDDGWTYLLPEEQRAVLTCEAIPEPDRMLIAFAIGTGLRQGELWNLELVDLVVEGPYPHVMVRWGKPGHKPPKNGKVRRVPLFGIALAAARRWLQLIPVYCRNNPLKLAFPTARGCRRRDSKAPRGWRGYLAAAGLADASRRHDGRAVRWHDLRHTCASSLVAAWWGRTWRLDEVRDVLGHTSITVTERYAHLAPGVLAEAGRATMAELPTLPKLSPPPMPDREQNAANQPRATKDSNLWPSAPEFDALLNGSAHLDSEAGKIGETLRPLAERVLRAVAGRSRFAGRLAVQFADAFLTLTAAPPRAPPQPAASSRPGLARARAAPPEPELEATSGKEKAG
jgi:integrase